MVRFFILAVLSGSLWFHNASADVVKASGWIDLAVVTANGELLGRVEDFAIESDGLSLRYVVVAVGSFLIDDNLIAIDPAAFQMSADGEYLIVSTVDISSARRFGVDGWPEAADVLASVDTEPLSEVEAVASSTTRQGFQTDGVASISDGQRTAMIRNGERSVSSASDPMPKNAPEPGVSEITDNAERLVAGGEPDATKIQLPSFISLDRNDDGRLDRREIGARLGRAESFGALDIDESGYIDSFEFDLLIESRH